MLQALYDEMIRILEGLNADQEKIAAYKRHWSATLEGHSKSFPCPACHAAGQENSSLKPQPAKGSIHYVRCGSCDTLFSYVEEEH